jgi:hypothetical protein
MALSRRAANLVSTQYVAIKIAAHNGIPSVLPNADELGSRIAETPKNSKPTAGHRRQIARYAILDCKLYGFCNH